MPRSRCSRTRNRAVRKVCCATSIICGPSSKRITTCFSRNLNESIKNGDESIAKGSAGNPIYSTAIIRLISALTLRAKLLGRSGAAKTVPRQDCSRSFPKRRKQHSPILHTIHPLAEAMPWKILRGLSNSSRRRTTMPRSRLSRMPRKHASSKRRLPAVSGEPITKR